MERERDEELDLERETDIYNIHIFSSQAIGISDLLSELRCLIENFRWRERKGGRDGGGGGEGEGDGGGRRRRRYNNTMS